MTKFAVDTLNAVIAEFAEISGPVTFSVEVRDDGIIILVGTYSRENTYPGVATCYAEDGLEEELDELDEVSPEERLWRDCGGYRILERAGYDIYTIDFQLEGYTNDFGDELLKQSKMCSIIE